MLTLDDPGLAPHAARSDAAQRLPPRPGADTLRIPRPRDIVGPGDPISAPGRAGRNLIAVIGIDRYQRWPGLANAVNDARGVLRLFERLGFEQAAPLLLDDAATSRAIQSLVADDRMTIGPEDSLVLFYSGHGGNRKHRVGDRELTTGYLIPVDAEDTVSSWVDLEAWLRFVALLPAKHILVILDACHSGIALDPVIRWRGGAPRDEPLSTLRARTSRRIITSARSGQLAMDGGPYPGHSLFTGCLIEALTHGLRRNGELMTTATELGLHLRQRVASYPQSQQTPDFGTFAFDQRGDMVLSSTLDDGSARREAPPASTRVDPRHIENDSQGAALATGGGSKALYRDDPAPFWKSVEQLLDPPTTIRGTRTRRFQAYRHGAFASNVQIGVVANANGAMRVHLWSTHRDHQQMLRSIEREVLEGAVAIPALLGALKIRPAEKGQQLYLEFAWQRSGPYLTELERVKASVRWFVGAAKNRFR